MERSLFVSSLHWCFIPIADSLYPSIFTESQYVITTVLENALCCFYHSTQSAILECSSSKTLIVSLADEDENDGNKGEEEEEEEEEG